MEKKTIGAFLAVLRKANGMTQQQVADRLNVSNKTVSKWECDESLPDITLIPALAEMFHVTSDEILRGQRLEQRNNQEVKSTEKSAEKSAAQAKSLIARTKAKNLNWTMGAAALMALGVIAAFTVSYGFYRPVLGFGVFLMLTLAALAMGWLSFNTARTALTGGDLIDEEDSLSAEKELMHSMSKLISAAAVALVWTLPLVLVRHEYVADSVISWSSYLELSPVMLAASVLAAMLAGWGCSRVWPELRGERDQMNRQLKRLYVGAGCVLVLLVMAFILRTAAESSRYVRVVHQDVEVLFDDAAAGKEYQELVSDFKAGGDRWVEYCRENLEERGIPWKGSVTDAGLDFLKEWGYVLWPGQEAYSTSEGASGEVFESRYAWAFSPDMQSADGSSVWFDLSVTRSGTDSGVQFGRIMYLLAALVLLSAAVILRRRYILKSWEKKYLYERALSSRGEKQESEEE